VTVVEKNNVEVVMVMVNMNVLIVKEVGIVHVKNVTEEDNNIANGAAEVENKIVMNNIIP